MDKIIHSYVKEATRPPEYQVVLIVEYDDGRMFPLTEQLPKCLLPIANRKLLAYQIDMMVKSGVEGEIVVVWIVFCYGICDVPNLYDINIFFV